MQNFEGCKSLLINEINDKGLYNFVQEKKSY